jgi:hypothetical protein
MCSRGGWSQLPVHEVPADRRYRMFRVHQFWLLTRFERRVDLNPQVVEVVRRVVIDQTALIRADCLQVVRVATGMSVVGLCRRAGRCI